LRKCDLFDRVYDTNITVTPLEQEIINAEIFRRLKEIKQLGLAYLIYSKASHSRFEHSLGTMYLAGRIAKTLELSKEDVQYFRLAALLHDVGHGPFSHAFEDYLRERKKIRGHEELTRWVILNSEIKDIIDNSAFDSKKVADLSIGKIRDEKRDFLNSLILGAIDVDKIDFLVRDYYYTERRHTAVGLERLTPFVKKVKNDKVAWDYQYLNLLEAFFRLKHHMYMSVYYSKKVRATDIMIKAVLKYSDDYANWYSFKEIKDFELLTDSYVLDKMHTISHLRSISTEMDIAVRLYKDLLKKNILKNAFEKTYFQYEPSYKDFLKNVKEEILSKLDSLNVDPRLVFVDTLYFSPGSFMSFTKTGQAHVYVQRDKEFISITNAQESLRELLSKSYWIIRVYIAPEYAKRLKRIREILNKMTENLFGET